MLLTQDSHQDDVPVPIAAGPTMDLMVCQECGMTFTTKHGLQKHTVRYHRPNLITVQTPREKVLFIHFNRAVDEGRCGDLLKDDAMLEFLMSSCRTCGKDFNHRNLLTRHFRQHHSLIWEAVQNLVIMLETDLRHQGTCYCKPMMKGKHQCVVFLQFAVRQLTKRYFQTKQDIPPIVDVNPMPPLITMLQMIRLCIHWGCVDLIFNSQCLRQNLTRACLLCSEPWHCYSSTILLEHLQRHHSDVWIPQDPFLDILVQHCFHRLGCLCEPHDVSTPDGYNCSILRQLAMIQRQEHPMILPCPVDHETAEEILTHALTSDQAATLTRHLLLRKWTSFLLDTDLIHKLRVGCLLCAEDSPVGLSSNQLADHLLEEHAQDTCVSPIMSALADFYIKHIPADTTCHVCGLQVDGLARHYVDCHVVLQMSMILNEMVPTGYRYVPPAPRGQAGPPAPKTLDDCFAGPSDLTKDAISACMLILCTHFFGHPAMKQQAQQRCLLCDKLLLTEGTLWKHLLTHLRHGTMPLYEWLTQHITFHMPCRLCDALEHQDCFDGRCLPLLNLVILLHDIQSQHGRRGPRRASTDLVWCDAQRRSEEPRPTWQSPQKTSSKPRSRTPRKPDRPPSHGGTPRAQTRKHPGHHDHGTRVCDPHGDERQGTSAADDVPVTGLAPEAGETHAIAASAGVLHDEAVPSESDKSLAVHTGERYLPGQCEAGDLDNREDPSLPDMVSSEAEAPAQREDLEGRGTHEHPTGDGTDAGRSKGHPEVSFAEASSTRSSSPPFGGALAVDGFLENPFHPLDADIAALLSRHLATSANAIETPKSTTLRAGQSNCQELVVRQGLWTIRVMSNRNSKQCYINAPMISLCWMALELGAMHPSAWMQGFSLIQQMTMPRLSPFDICRDQTFLNLIWGIWDTSALEQQNDATEFSALILPKFDPVFLHMEWQPSQVSRGDFTNHHLLDEHGSKSAPIELNIVAVQKPSCSIQELVNSWQHTQDMDRSLMGASPGLILNVYRTSETGLDHTALRCHPEEFTFPVFDVSVQQVVPVQYRLVAVVIHVGNTLNSGHYTSLIRTSEGWRHYDDNTLPVQRSITTLACEEQVMQLWAIRIVADEL